MIYCVFLKQVSFHKMFIQMDDLKNLFETNGFNDVKTVIRSGNVLFSSEENVDTLYAKIKEMLHNYYNYDINIFIRNIDEIKQLIANNPYEIEKGFYHQVFICNNDFVKTLEKEFLNCVLLDGEKFIVNNGVLYWKYLKLTRFTSNILKTSSRETLKHNFTLRTVGTLEKVISEYLK